MLRPNFRGEPNSYVPLIADTLFDYYLNVYRATFEGCLVGWRDYERYLLGFFLTDLRVDSGFIEIDDSSSEITETSIVSTTFKCLFIANCKPPEIFSVLPGKIPCLLCGLAESAFCLLMFISQ